MYDRRSVNSDMTKILNIEIMTLINNKKMFKNVDWYFKFKTTIFRKIDF